MSDLNFTAGIDRTQWKSDIDAIRRDLLGLNSTVQSETQKMDSSFRTLGAGIAGYFSGQALLGFAQKLINVRGEFQKTEIAFTTMLGSAEKSKVLMGQMVDLAAKTPFGLEDVTDGAKRLLAFQVPAEQVVDTLTRIGNVAAGLGVPMGQLIHVYGQVKAQGKLMTNDLYQFMNAGIPMTAELAKVMGVAENQVKDLISAGKVGFPEVQKVIANLTNEGGMFFNLMEAQSKSLSGQIANLEDNFTQMLNKIGESSEGILNSGIEGLSYLVEHYEEVGKVILSLVAIYGEYRAVLMVTSALQKAQATPAIIQGIANLSNVLKGATVSQEALNSATLANPYVLVATALLTLVTVAISYRKEIGDLLGITKELTDSQLAQKAVQDEYTNSFSKGVAEQKANISQLISVIKNEYSTLQQRESAYKKLIAISPAFEGTLDSQLRATNKLGEAFMYVTQRAEQFAVIQAQMAVKMKSLTEFTEKQFDAGRLKNEVNDLISLRNQLEQKVAKLAPKAVDQSIWSKNSKDVEAFKQANEQLSAVKAKISDVSKEWRATQDVANSLGKTYNQNGRLIKSQTDELQKGIAVIEAQLKGGKVNGKDISADYRKKLETRLADDKEKLSMYVGIPKIDTSEAEKEIEKSTDKVKKSKEKHEKELAEVFSEASIADLEKRISEWNNALQRADTEKDVVKVRKTDKYGKEKETGETVTIAEAKKQVEELEKAKAEAEKKIQRLSFDEQLAEDERQWNIRYQIAKQYGEDIAKAQFPNLKGDSYFDELKSQYDALTKKIEDSKTDKSVIVSKTDIENATKIKTILDSLTGTKDSKTQYFDDLDEELAKLKTFTEKKALLDKKESELTTTEKDNKYIAELASRKEANIKSWKETYDAILEEQKTYEEKSAELAKQYATAKETDQYKNGSSADRLKVDEYFKKQQGILDIGFIKDSKEWEAAFGDVELMTKNSLQRILEKLLEFKEKSKGTLSLQDTVELEKAIERVRSAASKNPFTNLIGSYNGYTTAIKNSVSAQKEVEQAQEEYNSTLDETGNKTDATAAAALKLAKAQKKGIQADIDATAAKKKLIDNLQTSQNIFNAVGEGVMQLSDAFGGFDDATNDAIGNIMAIGNAAMDLEKSIASGNIAGMTKAGVQLIDSIGKALNGDQKKERQIKKQVAQLKELETAYNNLAYAAEKAYGSQKYSAQTDVIKNLEQQKIALQGMINTESSKKKADKGKIAEWERQIQAIDQAIDQMKTKIVEDVLQTSVVDAAAQVGDALVDAFGRGESAVDSLNNAANDMIENLLKNQLNLMLQARMQPILDDLLAATGMNADGTGSFNELTPEEIASFKAQVEAAGEDMQGFLETYSDIFGGLDANASSLEGAIKGVSEETASLIAGQMNAIRIVQAQMLENSNISIDVLRNSLLQLTQIEINTRFLRLIYLEVSKNKDDGSIRASGLI